MLFPQKRAKRVYDMNHRYTVILWSFFHLHFYVDPSVAWVYHCYERNVGRTQKAFGVGLYSITYSIL
jgi:hypothetical protein